jgi:hypothetical protein
MTVVNISKKALLRVLGRSVKGKEAKPEYL